ncbi:hypothetical protein AMK15_17325 [Streptomyces sp. MJM1172]|nr:hypothetical protein AMK15_17325 [Streptomyces sp. MJM1172]
MWTFERYASCASFAALTAALYRSMACCACFCDHSSVSAYRFSAPAAASQASEAWSQSAGCIANFPRNASAA